MSVLTQCSACLHNASMPNILIRNVPEPVHARLGARARAAGLSLQQFCLAELERMSLAQTPQEAVDDIRSGLREFTDQGFLGLESHDVVATIREMRGPLGDD